MIPTPTIFAGRLADTDYRDLLARLLPRGKVWSLGDLAGGLALTLLGMGAELARVHNRLLDVLDECDPSTTTDLIDDWERVLDLPDPDDPAPPVLLADRRAVATAKLIATGGMQPYNIWAMAQAAGYPADVEVQVPILFRADESASDERAYDGQWDPGTWTFCWYVWREVAPPGGWARLETILDRHKHANTNVIFLSGVLGGANDVATPT